MLFCRKCFPLANSLAFFHGEDLIYPGQNYFFLHTVGPVDLDRIHFCGVAQAEVYAGIVIRDEAASAEHIPALAHAAGGEIHRRTDCVTRAFCGPPIRLNLHPVMMVGVHVAQQRRDAGPCC